MLQYPSPTILMATAMGFSLNDMLDLLSVYGQEFPESFATDTCAPFSTSAT